MISNKQLIPQMDALLQQINEQYEQLKQEGSAASAVELGLFEATVHYFAAHVHAFHRLQSEPLLVEKEMVLNMPTPSVEPGQPVVMTSEYLTPSLSQDENLPEEEEVLEETSVKEEVYTIEDGEIFPEEEEMLSVEGEEDGVFWESEEDEDFLDEDDDDDDDDDEEDNDEDDEDDDDDEDNDDEEDNDDDEDDDFEDNALPVEEVKAQIDPVQSSISPRTSFFAPIIDAADTHKPNDSSVSSMPSAFETSMPADRPAVPAEDRLLTKKDDETPSTPPNPQAAASAAEAPTRPMSINELLGLQKKEASQPSNSMESANRPVLEEPAEKVKDIRMIISLNDKLLFIKDLFNGYSLAYSEAMELLNRYDTFEDAQAFLQSNYAIKNQWQDKPSTVEKLMSLMRKRFH